MIEEAVEFVDGVRTYRVYGLGEKVQVIGTAVFELDAIIGDRIDIANKVLAAWQGRHAVTFAEELNEVLAKMTQLRSRMRRAGRVLSAFPDVPGALPGMLGFFEEVLDGIVDRAFSPTPAARVQVPAASATASAIPGDLHEYALSASGQDERLSSLANTVNLDGVTADVSVERSLNAAERQRLIDAGAPPAMVGAETTIDIEAIGGYDLARLVALPDPQPLVSSLIAASFDLNTFVSGVALAFEQADQALLDLMADHPEQAAWIADLLIDGRIGSAASLALILDPVSTSSHVLGLQLEAVRASGLAPSAYAGLLEQYWLTVAAERAGLDLSGWDPRLGADAMLPYLVGSYRYYGQLYLDDPDFQWAGMAAMIGPTFAGGMFDLQLLESFSDIASASLDAVPGWAKAPLLAVLPEAVRNIALLGELGEAEFDYYETSLLSMQKQIFTDQAPMHEAYRAMGVAGIDEMYEAGIVDADIVNAWRDIDSRDPARVQRGNTNLLLREQDDVIRDDYRDMRHHHGPVGEAVTYMMGAIGTPGIPGAQSLGEYDPLAVGVSVDPWGPGPHASVEVVTPLPEGNIADFDTRWDLIVHDTLPAYQGLIRDHPEQVEAILTSDVEGRIDDARLSNNLGELLERLSDWEVHVDGGLW